MSFSGQSAGRGSGSSRRFRGRDRLDKTPGVVVNRRLVGYGCPVGIQRRKAGVHDARKISISAAEAGFVLSLMALPICACAAARAWKMPAVGDNLGDFVHHTIPPRREEPGRMTRRRTWPSRSGTARRASATTSEQGGRCRAPACHRWHARPWRVFAHGLNKVDVKVAGTCGRRPFTPPLQQQRRSGLRCRKSVPDLRAMTRRSQIASMSFIVMPPLP